MKKAIALTPTQVGWLRMLKPEDPYSRYLSLRGKYGNAVSNLKPLDHGGFGSFVRGDTSRDERDAAVIFEAYGTNQEQVELVEEMGLRFGVNDEEITDQQTDTKLDDFFRGCGSILWDESTEHLLSMRKCVVQSRSRNQESVGISEDVSLESALLGLVDVILVNRGLRQSKNRKVNGGCAEVGCHDEVTDKSPFSNVQKRIVFGELLDYLIENRSYDRWSSWMTALSRGNFRKAFSQMRRGKSLNWFSEYAFDASDSDALTRLSAQELEELAFFIRQLNMRINEIRHRNFVNEQKRFDRVVKVRESNRDALSLIYKEIKDATLERKVVVRNSFKWALDNICPCWHALSVAANPHRWFFLMCATRLLYDWARWNYYSVRKEDQRHSCDMYREILRLSEICDNDGSADTEILCRFRYMASTACRYMAECSAAGIWGDKNLEGARWYVNKAVELAGAAMRTWDEYSDGKIGGKYAALRYRFRRHYARQTTFAARWWLQHPQKNGLRFLMPEKDDILISKGVVKDRNWYGGYLLQEAHEYCKKSICAPLGPDEKLYGIIRLKDKRNLEYEFHLRVWIELLVWDFGIDCEDDEPMDVDHKAMVAFCQIICIYHYLFASADVVKKMTSIDANVARASRIWLAKNEGDKVLFDVSQLSKTIQAEPPSVEETRFEIVTSIMHSAATTQDVLISTLWRTLEKLADKVSRKKDNPHGKITSPMSDFVYQIWLPARKGLETDLQQSIRKVVAKTKKFNDAHVTYEALAKDWKNYPPFEFRNALVNAPGNNPRHVEVLMQHYGLSIDKIKKEWGAVQ